jgi:hypothetical protein
MALALLVGAMLAGCSLVPGNQGDPSAPVLVTGRILDAAGAPVGNAFLELQVFDDANVEIGQTVPIVFHQSFTANADGTFTLHLAPTAELRAFGTKNGGFVNFQLFGAAPNHAPIFPFAFSRDLGPAGWADAAPIVTISPNGIDQQGEDPGVPAPLPAET